MNISHVLTQCWSLILRSERSLGDGLEPPCFKLETETYHLIQGCTANWGKQRFQARSEIVKFGIKGLNAAWDREVTLALLQGISKEGSRECIVQLCQCTGVGGHFLLHPHCPHSPHLPAPGGPALHSSTPGNPGLKDRSGDLSSGE